MHCSRACWATRPLPSAPNRLYDILVAAEPEALRAHAKALFDAIPQPVEADVSAILAEHQHGTRRRGRRVPSFSSAPALENGGASCPAHDNNPIARYEGYYASVFYSHIAALGLDLTAEDANHHGRIDLTLKFNGRVWLFEFKVLELCPAGSALDQLKARGYADKYRGLSQPIHLIGIEFSRAQRTLVGFDVETC